MLNHFKGSSRHLRHLHRQTRRSRDDVRGQTQSQTDLARRQADLLQPQGNRDHISLEKI